MDHYKLSQFEKVKAAETKLSHEISELKNEVEENEMLFGQNVRPSSSIATPMNPEYFKAERTLALQKALDVSGVHPLKSQSQVIMEEVECSLQSDVTEESLPLFLHQFYLNQMQSLVQCNHMHMLRWRRLCKHTEAIERMYPKYRQRLNAIKKDYDDAKLRSQRLSAAYHSFVMKNNKATQSLKPDDIAIFFRWLVVHLHSTKKICNYLKLLQWLPVIHRNNIELQLAAPVRSASDTKSKEWFERSKPPADIMDPRSSWPNMSAGVDFSFLSPASTSRRSSKNATSMNMPSDLAFSGFVSNEVTMGIPCHVTELAHFRDQLEALTAEYGIPIRSELVTSADEMELFGAVNRHFKGLFNRQNECLTFHQYDNPPEGYEHWGIGSASHCLKKPSNWVKSIQFKPKNEANQLRQMTYLKEHGNIDELLRSQNRFLNVSDFAQVTEALKEHAVAVREPPLVQAISVATNVRGKLRSASVWDRIYENAEKYASYSSSVSESSRESGEKKFSRQSRRKESYDYANTMQMLGLDEGDDSSSQDPTVIQGAYLSFLHLRHLKIRDLRRQCLGILNYFRSIERTITIYDGGLSQEANNHQEEEKEEQDKSGNKKKKVKSSTHLNHQLHNRKSNQSLGGKGHSMGIGSHQYAYNSPADYKIDQSKFMEFSGVENHDDFYTLDSDAEGHEGGEWRSSITAAAMSSGSLGAESTPHVQDHRGYFVMYESALKDFQKVDEELILVASQYIEKHNTDCRSSAERADGSDIPGDVHIPAYAHRDVDRFAVLLDVWTCELNFMVNKRKLLDILAEAYQTTFDHMERQNIAQLITDLLHQRPRYDFTNEYFIRTYRGECACLRLKTILLSQILTSHMDECKHYLSKISRPFHIPGMPLFSTARQEISVNLPRPSLRHVDMLEFHPTVGSLASRVLEAVFIANHQMQLIHKPSSMNERVTLEKQVLEHAHREWEGLTPAGTTYTKQIQKDLFSEDFVEDVHLLNDAVQSLFSKGSATESESMRSTEADRKEIETWIRALDLVFLRHRLIDAAWETELLARLYKRVASEMGYDEFHMYLRLLQFEFASRKDRVDPSPSMISSFVVDDMNADRYVPSALVLAAHEMDENHISKFSFRNRENFLQMLESSSSVENFRIALACQVAHKNSLTVAVTLAENCARWRDAKSKASLVNGRGSSRDLSDSRSNLSDATTATQMTLPSRVGSPPASKRQQLGSTNLKYSYEKQKSGSDQQSVSPSSVKHVRFSKLSQKKMSPEAFLSIQLEKLGPRDVIVNAFVRKKETQGMLLKKEEEIEKLKRSLISDFCKEFSFRMGLHAKRSQIIASYSGILAALESFPSTRDNYFLIGRPHEKKRKLDDVSAMIPDPKVFQKRPRRVMSPDGKCFMNLWFLPHFTEVINAYRSMDYEIQENILDTWLVIATSLHDIILHLCSRARLGSSAILHKSGKIGYTAAADWGGAEGIGTQLSELQDQVNSIDPGPSPYTQDPNKIAELLSKKKEVLFLEFDAAVRHSMREAFLAMNNVNAYQTVTDNMRFGLPPLSDVWESSITCIELYLPLPLDPGSKDARNMYPWLSFQHSNGRHPTDYPEYWQDPESCMQLCVAGLNDIERQLANGELLGVSVLLQEVLNNGTIAYQSLQGSSEDPPKGFVELNPLGKLGENRPKSVASHQDISKKKSDQGADAEDAVTKELHKKKKLKFDPCSPLDKIAFPVDSFDLMKKFLRVWKQLELFKLNWAKLKLHLQSIDTPSRYREMNHIFRSEVLLLVYTALGRQMGHANLYDEIASDDLPLHAPPGAPELTVKARVLVKLLELREMKMISETRHRIGREYTFALAERSRDETALPADLWRQHQGSGGALRENFVVSRPHFVDDFIRKLLSDYDAENGSITFPKSHLNDCLSILSGDVMKRERENYENYSIYYESLLRHHHHLLYVKELEMRAAESEHKSRVADDSVQAQFQLADRSHELILEITALRAKVTEMREKLMESDQEVREEVRRDYQDLVQNLFEVCFQMKSRLALCHLSIHDDVRSLISETRTEAMKALGKLKNETPTSTAEERLLTISQKEQQVQDLQEDQCNLNKLLLKLQALHHWKQSTSSGRYKVTIEKLNQEVNKTRRDCMTKTLISKEEAELRFEELQSARRSLEGSNDKLKKTFEQIERDKKLQKEKEYKELQDQRNRRQIAQARQRDMERMMMELQEKDKRLRSLTADMERHTKIEQNNQSRIQRNLKQMHAQLSLERTLKLDAFDRVDNLQAQVLDTDREGPVVASSRPTSASISICKSATTQRSRTQSAFLTSPTPTPSTPKHRVRPLSCGPLYQLEKDVELPRKRPQTAANTLRNRIAATILTDAYPPTDEHETVVRLGKVAQ